MDEEKLVMRMPPLIKWTGSKRPIAEKIVSHFPTLIDTYYEPFLGGGSVFFKLLSSGKGAKHYVLSDLNESLIEIFKITKDRPDELVKSYRSQWEKLQKDSNYYYEQRDLFNKTKDPLIFYFLSRTCYNGTIRFNKNGEFNVAYHFGRPGMNPNLVEKAVSYHSDLMKEDLDIEFSCKSFEEIQPQNKDDVVYLDPPYTNTKALYFGNISLDNLVSWISHLPCSWYMNLNGINGKDNEENLFLQYTGKEILSSGKSSFSRLKNKDVKVGEYFYWKILDK